MMDLTPDQVVGTSFRTVRKGYDPDAVDAFLERAAKALEEAQQQSSAMEARARAAVARLQEAQTEHERLMAEHASAAVISVESTDSSWATTDEAETISRALILAQRTADRTIADAHAEAETIRAGARSESETTLDSTREMSSRLLEEARVEARRTTEAERTAAEHEVHSLVARREALLVDVDRLEQFSAEQRSRLREAARQIEQWCDDAHVLGSATPPELLPEASRGSEHDTSEQFRPPTAERYDLDDPLFDDPPDESGPDAVDPATSDSSETSDYVESDDPIGFDTDATPEQMSRPAGSVLERARFDATAD